MLARREGTVLATATLRLPCLTASFVFSSLKRLRSNLRKRSLGVTRLMAEENEGTGWATAASN
jgi:hypothetical protein